MYVWGHLSFYLSLCVCVCECHHFSLCAEIVSCDGTQDSSAYHSNFLLVGFIGYLDSPPPPPPNNHVLVKGLNVIIFKVFIRLLLCVEYSKVIVVSLNPLVPSIFYTMHMNIMDTWK